MTKGVIMHECTVWCGCGAWQHDGRNSDKREAAKVFKHKGWKYERERGWVCPQCLAGQRSSPDYREETHEAR